MKEVKEILGEAEEAMEMAIMYLDEQFAHIRAGKANVRILDGIRVNSYGSMVPETMVELARELMRPVEGEEE